MNPISLAATQAAGFSKAVIYESAAVTNGSYTTALVNLMKSYGFTPWLYCVDEIIGGGDMTTQNLIAAAVEAAG